MMTMTAGALAVLMMAVLLPSPSQSHAFSYSKCVIKLKGCANVATYNDFAGFVEINGVRVREFNTNSTGANGPGLRVFSMNYHCQVSDIFRIDVNSTTGDISRNDGLLFTQFILSVPQGAALLGVSCGGTGDKDGKQETLHGPMGAIGVKTGIDGTGILMFTARKGYPWQAVQRLIDGTSTTPVYNIPEYLETTVYQYPSYYMSPSREECVPSMPPYDFVATHQVHDMVITPGLQIGCSGYIAGFHMILSGASSYDYYPLYVGIWRNGKPVEKVKVEFQNVMKDALDGSELATYLFPDERVYVMPGDYLSTHTDNYTYKFDHPVKARVYLDYPGYDDFLYFPSTYGETPSRIGSTEWDKAIGSKILYDMQDSDWDKMKRYHYYNYDLDDTNGYSGKVGIDYAIQQMTLQPIIVQNRTEYDALPHQNSEKILDDIFRFNDLESDYSHMGHTYFFPEEKINMEGRIVAFQYNSLNEGGFYLIFFNDDGGNNYDYKGALEVPSCLGVCYYRLPDDFDVVADSTTFFAFYYSSLQVVGTSDTALGYTTRAREKRHTLDSFLETHAFYDGSYRSTSDIGLQPLPSMVIYVTDFTNSASISKDDLPERWTCIDDEDCIKYDELMICGSTKSTCECPPRYNFYDLHRACIISNNLAYLKDSYQSEDIPLWDAGAKNAVSRDSNPFQYFSWWDPGACSRTARTGSERPWWLVDLGQEYRIHKVEIAPAYIDSDSYLQVERTSKREILDSTSSALPLDPSNFVALSVNGYDMWMAYDKYSCSSSCQDCYTNGSISSSRNIFQNQGYTRSRPGECIKNVGGAFYRRVEDDRCLRFENLNLKLSEDDDKTKCKGGARWFTAERDILSAVDYHHAGKITVDKCLYTWEPAGHGDSVYFGYPSYDCAHVVKEPVADNDGYFYLRVNTYYTRWNDTGLVLVDSDGDLFYEDKGYPDNGLKMKVVGVLTADPPSSQPGDRCRTGSKGIYRSNFPRTPIVQLVAGSKDVIVELSSTKRNRFTYEMCKKRASANWATVKIYYRVTLNEMHDLVIGVGNSFNTDVSHFSPESFSRCAHFQGDFPNSPSPRSIPCEEVHSGRYLSIHIPDDGLLGGTDTYLDTLNLCDVQVFGAPVCRLGSICDTDDWCQREDSNLICDDNNVCSCMDGFAVSPDSKSTVCTAVGMWKSPCNQDSDCLEDSHMWCYEVPDGGICRCQPGFSYNAIIKICEPEGIVGSLCFYDENCTEADIGSECLDHSCKCKLGYFFSELASVCLSNGTLGLPCSGETLEEDCMDINMECDMGLCECQPDFTFNYLQQRCEPDPTMGEACSMDSDCNQHHSECSGVCSCVDGYEYDQFALECYPVGLHGSHCTPSLETTTSGFKVVTEIPKVTTVKMLQPTEEMDVCTRDDPNLMCLGGQCECSFGYRYNYVAQVCMPVDRHASSCPSDEYCQKSNQDFICLNGECTCRLGYLYSNISLACREINECVESSPDPCTLLDVTSECVNTPGDYYCHCPVEGYTWDFVGTDCQNIDECKKNNGGCEFNCTDTTPGYYCTCPEGYMTYNNALDCIDLDECEIHTDDCEQVCYNHPGNYSCDCIDGYVLGLDEKRCKDVKECEMDKGGCDHNCFDTIGSYYCTCDNGYYGAGPGNHVCLDIEECQDGMDICQSVIHAECENTVGSYYCYCEDGYDWNEGTSECDDVNECGDDNGGCMHRCHNVPGTYMCSCLPGYGLEADEQTCSDIDECHEGTDNCRTLAHASCENTVGSYECECEDEGYTWNVSMCQNINECLERNGGCQDECDDTDGSYTCHCFPGFLLIADQQSCIDINECIGPDPCEAMDPLAECMNSIGSYHCVCPDRGYDWDSDHCEDIDECDNSDCEQLCHNTVGSYTCHCEPGYKEDGISCQVVENQYVTRLIIWFREDFQNYLSNSGDERTQSTSAAVERWVNAVGNEELDNLGFTSSSTVGFIEGSIGIIIDLGFDHVLNNEETSSAAWVLSEILTSGNTIGSIDGTGGGGLLLTPFDTRGDALTLVSEGQDGEQILTDVANLCSVYEALDICKNDAICEVNEENSPECKCAEGYTGNDCTEEEDDFWSTEYIVIAAAGGLVLLILIIILVICCARQSAQSAAQHLGDRTRDPDIAPEPWYYPYNTFWKTARPPATRPVRQPSYVTRSLPKVAYDNAAFYSR